MPLQVIVTVLHLYEMANLFFTHKCFRCIYSQNTAKVQSTHYVAFILLPTRSQRFMAATTICFMLAQANVTTNPKRLLMIIFPVSKIIYVIIFQQGRHLKLLGLKLRTQPPSTTRRKQPRPRLSAAVINLKLNFDSISMIYCTISTILSGRCFTFSELSSIFCQSTHMSRSYQAKRP